MSVASGKVEMLTGFDGTRLSNTQIGFIPSSILSRTASSRTSSRSRSGSGRQLWVPPWNGGDQLLWVMSFGLARSLTSTTTRLASRQAQ